MLQHAVFFALAFGLFGLLMMRLRGQGIVNANMDPNAPRDMAEVQRLAANGRLIEAIKLHRELTGLGLKESKDAVEAIARGAVPGPLSPRSSDVPIAEADARIMALLRQGKDIQAIKAHREAYGTGLAQAKSLSQYQSNLI